MNTSNDKRSSQGPPQSKMSEAELRAYAAGYNSATRLLKGIIDHWAQLNESHCYCDCELCMTLRAVANGRFGSLEIPSPRPKHLHSS